MSLRDFLIKLLTKDEKPEPRPRVMTSIRPDDETSGNRPIGKINAPLDVFDMNHKKICSCRLKEYSTYSLRLERLPDDIALPILNERDQVQVKGYTKDLKTIDLQGIVHKSTRIELDVGHIKRNDYDDMRSSFRQPVYAPAEIYRASDANMNTPEPCQLLNISTGGACVLADKKYNIEDNIRLRVELYPGAGPISFKGKIIRAILKESKEYEYGIIFAQITQQKKHDLERDMEELRAIMERTTYK